MARTGNVCGALTGALMALGLKFGDDREKANEVAGKFLSEFKSLHGSIICSELTGHNLSTVEDIEQAVKMEIFSRCQKFVEDVSMMLETLL
ncbi:MAG: C-GCAxxG-C-C family protein [Candidatus Hermodarchaeia archaeon]